MRVRVWLVPGYLRRCSGLGSEWGRSWGLGWGIVGWYTHDGRVEWSGDWIYGRRWWGSR
jgi:hypothetical protein